MNWHLPRCVLMPALPVLGLAILLGLGSPAGQSLPRPGGLTVAHAADEASAQAPEPTALVVSSTNAPYRVTANDGMAHLEYDLIFTSVFPAPVTVETVDVVDPAGSSLMHLEGSTLVRRIQQVFNTGVPAENFDAENVPSVGAVTEVPVGGTLAIVMDVVMPPDAVPARISHRITYALPADNPFLPLVNARTIFGPNLTLSTHDPIVLSPPVRGAGWYAVDACCDAESAHRSFRSAIDGVRIVKSETFAYDYLRIKNGRLFDGDGSRNDQWYDYGAEVVAAADGTVVFARDGMPEAMPGETSPAVQSAIDYQGNNVVVQIRPDVWATYAHLQPGSVKVQVGDHVSAGQLLGLLGSTGNSPIAPHLHFQLSDGPVIATSDSLPFEFDQWTLAGFVSEPDLSFVLANRDQPDLPLRGTRQPQTNTYALISTVQDFP